MNLENLQKSWAITCEHLSAAAALLPKDPVRGEEGGSLTQYEEWISHNELEFALEELVDLGSSNSVPLEYWQQLLAAAQNMHLQEHVFSIQAHVSSFGA